VPARRSATVTSYAESREAWQLVKEARKRFLVMITFRKPNGTHQCYTRCAKFCPPEGMHVSEVSSLSPISSNSSSVSTASFLSGVFAIHLHQHTCWRVRLSRGALHYRMTAKCLTSNPRMIHSAPAIAESYSYQHCCVIRRSLWPTSFPTFNTVRLLCVAKFRT